MLFSPTRPVTAESSWVPGRLPKPTRHPTSFFFLRRTDKYCSMVISFFFLHRTHKYCSMVVVFFFLRRVHKYNSFRPFFFTTPSAYLKNSPSDDESESGTFIFHRFRGRVHDNSIPALPYTLQRACAFRTL